ncbi:RNA polymerase subunit sigma-24 [Arenimonas soli]|uniref:RNA polymerase subunit sigma-24 n=1 Tax=Arenimonas soli TaxID=2269504 RepID=A0ABQ1HBH6_9GAMM|nr:sigma-70 family RNA polymerase sigma factor [Arenimonas soli]GGA68347.1 RNA polymerase subunit sigma-24 [Arenimonas soli]
MSLSVRLEVTVSQQEAADDPEVLARLYGPLVYKAAYRVLGDVTLAEDAQQEVFLRLLQAPRKGVESWPAYLTAASARVAIDMLRRQQRWWRVLPQWLAQAPTTTPSAEHMGIQDQQAEQLRSAIARLPKQQARCFGMRYLEGMEIGDIARALEISENNAGVILHRARRGLEAQLRETGTEELQ